MTLACPVLAKGFTASVPTLQLKNPQLAESKYTGSPRILPPTFGLLLDPNQTEATKPRVLTMQSSQNSGDHIQMQLEHVKRTYIVPVASGCTFRHTATKAQYSNRAQRGHKIAFLTQLDQAKTLPNPFPPHAQVWPRQILEVTNSEAVWNLATMAQRLNNAGSKDISHYSMTGFQEPQQVYNLPRILNDVKLFFQNSQKNRSFSWQSLRETSDLTKKKLQKESTSQKCRSI
jgi:hypothetical protein